VTQYATDSAFILYVVAMSLQYGRHAAVEARRERATRRKLLAQVAKAQGLLETAMPPVVARAIMSGLPAHSLTRSFPSASIAFICLSDYESHVGTMEPAALLSWLDGIWGTLDRLVDLYAETGSRLCVTRVVSGTGGRRYTGPA
jgi:hypothetical protein